MVDSVIGDRVRRIGMWSRVLTVFGQAAAPAGVEMATEERGSAWAGPRRQLRRGSFRRTGCVFDSLREGDSEFAHLVDPHGLDRLELVRWQVMARFYGAHPRKTY